MKTSVMEVHDMLSVLSVEGVEKRIGEVPGVESVTVNHAAGNATVRYDETRLDIADIRSDVRQSGYESDTAGDGSKDKGHEGHMNPDAPPETPAPLTPKPSSAAPVAKPAAPDATSTPLSEAPVAVGDAKPNAAPTPAASGGDQPPNPPVLDKN